MLVIVEEKNWNQESCNLFLIKHWNDKKIEKLAYKPISEFKSLFRPTINTFADWGTTQLFQVCIQAIQKNEGNDQRQR